MRGVIKDRDWVRQSFLINTEKAGDGLDPVDRQNRTFSAAMLKFTDTTPGGNFAINPPPQFTRFADLKPRLANGRPSRAMGSKGMGRYYSEAIDDNSQLITMRFGVPQYNSLTTFFGSFYNTQAGQLARTGRASNFFFNIGKATAFVVSIMSVRLLAVGLVGNGLSMFLGKKPTRYYYLKPAMHLYWNAVQTMVNHIATNKGLVPRVLGPDSSYDYGDRYQFDENAQQNLRDMMPDGVMSDGGSIQVYSIASKAQRMAQQHIKQMNVLAEAAFKAKGDALNDELSKKIQDVFNTQLKPGTASYPDYLKKWTDSQQMTPVNLPDDPAASNPDLVPKTGELPPAPKPGDPPTESPSNGATEMMERTPTNYARVQEALEAGLNDGTDFIAFRVNATGQVSENFTSQAVESEIASKINGISSAARANNFNFANGNLVGGALGSMVGAVKDAVVGFVGGVAEGFSMSGLATLNGGAFVDIPKHWQSSLSSMPHTTYTFDLVTPYGNPVSQIFGIDIPLCMILAGALPLSTGAQSYTSPFICELFDKGRAQIRLGMIDSLTVTRGIGNTGWSKDGQALGVQISFSVIDLSSILAMPITEGFTNGASNVGVNVVGGVGAAVGGVGGAALSAVNDKGFMANTRSGIETGLIVGGTVGAAAAAPVDLVKNVVRSVNQIFSDDTPFSDYMATLSAMTLTDQIYTWRTFKQNLTKNMATWDTWYSIPHYASLLSDSGVGRAASAIYKGTAR